MVALAPVRARRCSCARRRSERRPRGGLWRCAPCCGLRSTASRRFALDVDGDAALTLSLEVEVRHDGEVAGTGSGWKSASASLRRSVVEAAGSRVAARGPAVHNPRDRRARLWASLTLDAAPSLGTRASLSLRQTVTAPS